jgi:serine/threonine protein kinase
MSNEQVAATLAMAGEVPLPGLHNIEPNAARFIVKLLAKDPKERWTAEKSLEARFFRHLDDTTNIQDGLLLRRGGLYAAQHRLQGGQDSGREPHHAQGHADGRPAGRDRAMGARAQAAALRAE